MIKKMYLVLALFVLLTACNRTFMPQETNYYTGTKGVELEFVGYSPPNNVYEQTTFPLAIFVSNEGAFSLNGSPFKGLITYSYDPFYLAEINGTAESEFETIIINGKSDGFPQGDLQTKLLPMFTVKPVLGQRESPTTELFVSACYPYKTKLVDEVCIDTSSLTNDMRSNVCKAENKAYSGQGAPVAITEVHVQMNHMLNKIRPSLLIKIKNAGSGTVLAPVSGSEQASACDVQKDRRGDWNTVKIKALLSNEQLTCVPEVVHLRQGEGSARCFMESGGFGAALNYYAIMIVELDYVYLTSVSKEITIQRTELPDIEYLSSNNCAYWETEIDGVCKNNCEICSEGSSLSFCNSQIVDQNWSCDCGPIECTTIIGSRKLGGIVDGIEVKNGNCIFGQSFCAPGKYCCIKQ